jgi:thymidylate kinase
MLMFIDQVCFIKTMLTPFLEGGGLMLADRSNYVSGIVYGTCAGVDLATLNRMFKIAQSPAPDVMFILSCPFETLLERRAQTLRQTVGDAFDHNTEFLQKVATTYDNLLDSGDDILVMLGDYIRLGDIVYLDAAKSTEELADEVMARISQIQDKRQASESYFGA